MVGCGYYIRKGADAVKRKLRPEREYTRAFYKGNYLNFITVVLFSAVSGTFGVAASWVLGEVTDCMTAGDMAGLVRTAWITAVGIPVLCGLIWLYLRFRARFVRRAMTQYKAQAFCRISRKGISAFSRENTGRYLSALTNDANSIESQYLNYIPVLVENVFSFLVSLGYMLYCSPLLTLVLILASAFPVVASLTMSGRYAKLEQAVSDANESFTGRVKDLLSGFSVIKSFKAERETQTLFETSSARTELVKERKSSYAALVNAVSSGAGLITQLGTFLVGAYMALQGRITPGTVMMFVNLCNGVLNPIQNIPTYWAGIRASRGLIRKLAELTEENAARSGDPIEPVLKEGIMLRDLSFEYEEGKPVLRNVTLELEAGKKYAIVGASGSGKSTLLNLLMGSHDGYSGSITMDGKELRTIDPDSLYDLMSLIGQNVFLFDSTIRENITMFREFPEELVESAAQRSGLARVIGEKGARYRCGENGVGLSGGERQRVSIARALLRGSPVLMLDEATAALDNQTAFEVTDAILKLDGTTRIVVTHRLEEQLLRQYDRVIVLREGRVTEQGTFEELMKKTGYFYSLFNVSN